MASFIQKSKVSRFRRQLLQGIEQLEKRELLVSDWHNVLQPLNVTGDAEQTVTPLDVLAVINEINQPAIRSSSESPLPVVGADGKLPPPYVDVDCDNQVTPLDVLAIINAINNKDFGLSWRFEQNGGSGSGSGNVSPQTCFPKLNEGSSFTTSLVSEITIPSNADLLSFEFSTLQFDTTSQGRAHDAFEAALLDESGRSLVTSIGAGRDAFFNISEGLPAVVGPDATATTNKVSLSLTDILPGTKAQLVVRLVNNDGDASTSVVIPSLRFEQSTGPRLSSNARSAVTTNANTALSNQSIIPYGPSIASSALPVNTDLNAVPGRPASSNMTASGNSPAQQPNLNRSPDDTGGPTSAPPSSSSIDSRGKEFWIGFPDNLFEGNNRPQKVLYISGDTATTGVVDIPGLIDPSTSLPFHKDFVVNPGQVTVVELPSLDVGDNSDNDTDFDVEVELIAQVQRKGIHVVTQDPVTVYGLDLAISTSDAFLALPVPSLGTEYINLGYENTFASISSVQGTQFLVVATADNTQVTFTTGPYSGASSVSNAQIRRPNGTSEFNLFNGNGQDIGPFVIDAGGTGSLVVSPPFDGYAGQYSFELIDIETAAVNASLDEKVALNFPTGRESKVISYDVVAGQRLYYDAIYSSTFPGPSLSVQLLSPSGLVTSLSPQNDNNSFVNLFGALQFPETGKYYVLVTGENATAFDFAFRLVNMDAAPKISFGTTYSGTSDPSGRAEVFRFDASAGQVFFYDAMNADRNVGFTVYGPGGQSLFSATASDDSFFVVPETSTYSVVVDTSAFRISSYAFRLLDLNTAAAIPLDTPTTTNISGGKQSAFRLDGIAAQTFHLDVQSLTPFFRATYRMLDPAGKDVPLTQVGNRLSGKMLVDGSYTLLMGALTVPEGGDLRFVASLVADPVITKSGFNTIQTLSIAPGNTATYQFTAPAGTRILVDSLDSTNENLYVILNAPNGDRLFTGFGSANEQQDIPRFGPGVLTESGTYTLTLGGNTATAAGSYSFRVLDLDSAGIPLTLGSIVDGSFPTGRESVIYTFDANSGDKLLFDGITGSYIFGIYSTSLNAVYSAGVFGAAPASQVDGIGRVVQSGRHYVVFQGDPSISKDFRFSIANLAAAPTLTLGQEVAGTISGNSQISYRLPLTAGQRIRIDHLLPLASDVNFRIANAGGRVLTAGDFSNSDTGPPGNRLITVPESDEYFFSIQSRLTTSSNFRFRIDDLATVPLLTFDTDLEATLNPGNAAQVFRIQANAGETIHIDNLGSTGLPLNWEVTGPTTQYRGGSNDGLDFSATILNAGTHYFTLSGRQNNGPITVRFRATRTPGPAVPLSGFNTPVALDVGINETKTYSFSAPVGRIVYLNVQKSEFKIPDHTVTLNQGETYLVRDLNGNFGGPHDLTGSIITSTKPVAVLGGNRAAFVPSQFFAADHLVEQLPPTNTWGKEFVTMPLATDSTRGDRFRFLAQADNTEVKVNGSVVATLNRGQFFEQVIVGPSYIVSTKPILVAQYAHSQNYYRTNPGGNANFLGDPLMMIVPPYEQFLASYTVSTPEESSILNAQRFDRNFINVVTSADAAGLIELDGVPISANQFTPIGTSGFVGAQVPVQLGAYQLAGPVPFGVFVYGFGSFDSYGYVGGQSLSPIASAGSVTISPATSNPQVNGSQSFSIRVADVTGNPLEGIRIDIDVSGVNPQRTFGFSDANGLVVFNYTGVNAGRDIVTASVGQLLDDSIIDWRAEAVAPQVIVTAPDHLSSVAAGTTLVATGTAIADFPFATIDLITVNGVPVSNLDAAGNFFVTLLVGPGENEFEFAAIDSNSKVGTQVIRLTGTQRDPSQVDFTQFADVSGSFQASYARSSFHELSKSLTAETAVENIGQYPTDVPLLVAITNISDPSVLVRDPDGFTPDGAPYYDYTGLVTGGILNPRSKTGLLSAQFYNPNLTQFTYDLVFLGKLNEPPQITSLPTTDAEIAREYRYAFQAIDPNNDSLSYSLLESPPGMTIDAATGLLRWTPASDSLGVHSVEVQVTDSRQGIATQRFVVTARATPANRSPIFTSVPSTLAEVSKSFTFAANAIDADGDSLRYQLNASPSGMTIDANTGTITWTPTAQQLGTHPITVQVDDGRGASAEQSFALLVVSPSDNAAPVILSSFPTAIKLGTFEHRIVAVDAEGDTISYRLVQSPSGMTIDPSGLIRWTTTSAHAGVHAVEVEVLDSKGGKAIQQTTLAVFDNADPVITSQPNLTAQVNAVYNYQVTVSDAVDDVLSYRLSDAPRGMTIDPASGLIAWTPDNQAYVQERVTVVVTDGRGGIAQQSFSISVTGGRSFGSNQNPYFVSTPPTHVSLGTSMLYRAQARDPEGDTLTYDLPLAPDGMVIDPATGAIGWVPTSDQLGPQTIVVRAQDGNGGIWLQSFQLTVDPSNTAPVVTSTPLLSASVGNPWEYRIQVQDADADSLMFELISPPNGMTITALDQADADAVLRFTPPAAGTVNVGFIVRDNHGGETTQSLSIQVTASTPNVPPVVHSSPRSSIPIGQTWAYALDIEDENSDPLSVTLVTAPVGMTLDAGTKTLQWTPTTTQLGNQNVIIRVSDGRGGTIDQSFVVQAVSNSENHSPSIVSTPSASRATVGEPFAYDLRANDADEDPVEWKLLEAPRGASLDPRYGTLRWTPTLDDLGLQRFVVSATDPAGLESQQSFSLLVSGVNLGPSILSRAPSEAVADERYVYGVRAVDAENDRLTYALVNGPVGMTIDSTRGIIRWTPTLSQLGTANATVQLTDSNGNSTSQTFGINVTLIVRNREPLIQSRAQFRARVDAVYQYDVNAIDPEGDAITYSLVSGPQGMQIDSASGLITWTPTSAQIGSHLVQVAATDSNGGRGLQRFAVLARLNQVPVITSAALTNVALGGLYRYDVQATDADGDALRYELITGPAGMTMDALGRISWQTVPGVAAQHTLGLRVSDGFGGVATQSFTLNVTPDTSAPRVVLRLSANPLALGQSSVVVVQVSDNVGVDTVSLTMNGQPLVLDADHSTTLQGVTAGLFTLTANARDASGNVGTSTVELRVFDPADTQGPTITVTSPTPNSVVTSLTDIVGSITDNNLQFYRIDYGRADLVDINQPTLADPDYRTLAQGTTAAVDKVLASFDPTMLINDDYVVRILAQDLSGNVSTKVLPLRLDGQLKLGEFKLDFTDLSIPIAGVPITITRTYDTRNANEQGDFGYGWTLSVSDPQIRESLPVNPLEEEGLFFAATPFREGTKVYLTNPEGRRVGFTFRPTRQFSLFGGGSYAPTFVPDPGVYDTLDVGSVPLRKIGDSFYSGFFGDPFNPSAYRLTTKAGIVYEYGQFSGLDNVTDRNGNRLEFRPDGIFSSAGPSIQFVRDYLGRIEQIIDPAGNAIKYRYDLAGNLTSVADQVNNEEQYQYLSQPKHYLDNVVDSTGTRTFKAQFDDDLRLVGITDAAGSLIRQSIDLDQSLFETTDARGNRTQTLFDTLGNITAEIDSFGNRVQYSYSDGRNPFLETAIVDKSGNRSTATYDDRGNLLTFTNAQQSTYSYVVNEKNQIVLSTDALGAMTVANYDESGNVIEIVDSQGQATLLRYDSSGRKISLINRNGHETRYEYEQACACGNAGKVIHPDGSVEMFSYNSMSQITQYTDPSGGKRETTYDPSGRPSKISFPDGQTITYIYDGERLLAVRDYYTNDAFHEYRVEYDLNGRIVARIESNGARTQFQYDANGNTTQIVDSNGNVTRQEFDALNRLTRITDPLGQSIEYEYDAVGNRIAITDRLGRSRTFEFDALYRVVRETWFEQNIVVNTIATNYDAMGNVISVQGANSYQQIAWDNLRRVSTVASTQYGLTEVQHLQYQYDGEGNEISVSDQFGVAIRSQFDSMNRVSSQSWFVSGATPVSIEFEYDSRGNTKQMRRYALETNKRLVSVSNSEHDSSGRLTRLIHQTATNANLIDTSYSYDRLNRVTSETINNEKREFVYDSVGQLSTVSSEGQNLEKYFYDAVGNRVSSLVQPSYSVGLGNRLLSDGQFDYQYDLEGNLISKSDRSTTDDWTFKYDHMNRLVLTVHTRQGQELGRQMIVYDASGRRIAVTENGRMTLHTYNRDNVWSDYQSPTSVAVRYFAGQGIDQLWARLKIGEEASWYLVDRMRSVQGIVNSAGQLLTEYKYSAFGSLLSVSNPLHSDRFAFTSRELDPFTGNYYYRSRFYDSNSGRFVNEDPIRFRSGDTNLYRYVFNSPANFTDPSGWSAITENQALRITLAFTIGAASGWGQAAVCGADGKGQVLGAFLGGLGGVGTYGLATIFSRLAASSGLIAALDGLIIDGGVLKHFGGAVHLVVRAGGPPLTSTAVGSVLSVAVAGVGCPTFNFVWDFFTKPPASPPSAAAPPSSSPPVNYQKPYSVQDELNPSSGTGRSGYKWWL
jgi:RHS repeat-associated protein